ncbi:MAG: SDR family oxidoreductase [Pirellula sp.]
MTNSRSWAGRRTLVCGGTSGIGLQLAISLATQGAHVAIIGRDPRKLQEAMSLATDRGAASVVGFSVDLKAPNGSGDFQLLENWLSQNDVDLLVNAIGRSDRGPLELVSSDDLMDLFQDNVLCTWNMIRISLDSVKRASGVLINIGSLAGMIPSPNMGGYSIAKFGLTALSRQLRLELAKYGVSVLLVSSGPTARNDAGTRYDSVAKSRGVADRNTNAPAGGAKLRLLDPVILSDQILEAAFRRQRELVRPWKAKILAAIYPLWPTLSDRILKNYLPS